VWNDASAAGFVEAASEWGDNVDIDHVFPKSWANLCLVFAQELQVLKILGHPVGTASDPVSIFGVKRRR
jgi:hypothetical protein